MLDLCCECQCPEEEDGAGFDMIDVDSASSNEGEKPEDNDNEPEGFLMFSHQDSGHRRVSVQRRVSRRSNKKQESVA